MLHWYETLNQLGRVASEMEGRANYADCCRLQLALTLFGKLYLSTSPPPLYIYLKKKKKNQNKTNRIFSPSHVKKRMNLNLTVILDVKAKKQNCGTKETAFKWKIDLQSYYNSNSTTVMANMNLVSVITFPVSNPPNYIFHLIIYSKTSTTIQIIWKNFPLTPSFSAL